MKTLKTDPQQKVDNEVEKHRDKDEFPVFYGEVELDKILAHLPDGEGINATILGKITRSIEQAFRSADKQISATKDTYNLNKAVGLLVILNESIDIFNPEVILWKINQMFTKKTTDNHTRYNNITCVWIH